MNKDLDLHHNSKTNMIEWGDGTPIGSVNIDQDVPVINTPLPMSDTSMIQLSTSAISAYEMHRQLAHCGRARIKKNAISNQIDLLQEDFDCPACHQGKAKKQISRTPQIRARSCAFKFHADIQTVKPTSIEGYRYYLIAMDDKSRFRQIWYLSLIHI